MTNRTKGQLYSKTINVKVRQSTHDKIVEMAINSDKNKSEVMRSLFDVGLKVAEIEKQRERGIGRGQREVGMICRMFRFMHKLYSNGRGV